MNSENNLNKISDGSTSRKITSKIEASQDELKMCTLNPSPSSRNNPLDTSNPTNSRILSWQIWFIRLVRISVTFKSLPLAKVRSNGAMGMVESHLTLWMWYLRLVFLTLDYLYLISVSKNVKPGNVGEKEVIDFWIHTSTRILGCFMVWAVAANLQGTVQLYNTLASTQGIWRDRFGRYGSYFSGKLQRHLGLLFCAGTVYTSMQAIGPLIQHLTSRQSARYWGSHLLSAYLYNSIPGVIFFAAYDVYNSMLTIHCAIFGTELMICSYVLVRFWITDVRNKILKYGNSSIIPLHQYRSLFCLGCMVNQELGTTIYPTLTSLASLMLCVVLSALIKRGNELTTELIVAIATGCPLIVVGLYFVYTAGGEVISRSQEIKVLLERRNNLLRQKQVQSLKDIRLYLGQFYYMTKDAFIANMQWVVEHSIDIILVL